MLYPKEDKEHNVLLFECRICSYVEQAAEARVYRHELISNIGETAGIVKDLGSDPTLPRSDKECPQCHAHEAVFFQSQQRRADTSMILFYVCLQCNHTYRSV
jgi:DNA-directed RNA polymerase II subunit RPB9